MNTVVEVMTALASHDARVLVEGDRVRLLFSASHRPPKALVEAVRFHKQALRAILENRRETRPLGPHGHLLAALQSKCPELVEPDRWQQAVKDAENFLATWGEQAHALGWTARDLFGLHPVPERPAPSYSRLSRYNETGLIWLLRGRAVALPQRRYPDVPRQNELAAGGMNAGAQLSNKDSSLIRTGSWAGQQMTR
jgi:hypothetical protein